MELRYFVQSLQILTVTVILSQCYCHRLMLIEEHTLLRYKPSSRTYKLILQNPFEGKVSFKESESERFQLLFNISGNDDSVNYSLKKDLNALRVVLTASRRNPNVPSDNVNVEALNFLYIYAIGAACLVGLTTASGMFFLICWGGSKHNRNGIQNRARESDATKMPLLVSEPTTPRTNQHQFAETSVTDAATLPRYQAEPATQKRWIQSGNLNYSHNEGDSLVTNTLPTRGSANVRPAGILKRPSAGSSVSSAGGSSSLDRTSILNSAPPPAPLVPSSRCSDSNTDLDSNDSRKQGSVASSSSSRPRHIARDFLDESTMSGRTGVRRPNISTVCQPTMVAAAITKGLSSTPVTTTMVTTTTKDAPSPLPELPQFEPGIGLDWYRGGLSSAQGSDETSGIISDSDVSSLERQQQSQSSTSSSNNKLSSSLGGASTISSERFISLDSNDERYIALNVPASTPTPEIPPSSAASSGVGSDTPKIDMTIPRRSSAGTATVTSSNPSTPTLRPMAGSYTSSSTLSSASSVQTVLAADDVMGSNGGQMVTSGTSSLGRPFRQGISPVPPKRSVSLKGSTSFGEGGLEHAGEEEDGDFPLPPPPSTATSPRSALKGSRPPGPPINKQLRFTTITLLALMFLVSCAFGAMVKQSRKPVVGVTIFLPKSLMKSSRELESILLLLNRTSRTEVELGNYPRERVQIFDMVDAGHFTSTEECNSRYSCQHNCDHGLGYKCICERGYELMDSVRCKDTNECLRGNQPCMENRKKCTNLPGHYACDCPLEAKGLACGDCGSLCKPGFYIWQNCTENQPRVCKACSTCHTGSFVARACRTNANTECKGCNPLCRSDQYEFMPCTRGTNRHCRSRIGLPGIHIPFKDNIWYEDLARVVSVSTPNLIKAPNNRTLILDRGSGYTVKLKFVKNLNVAPVLEPEDHSRANDNLYYRSKDPQNRTRQQFCPYPLTKYYNLMMRQHNNVMSMAKMNHSLPGYVPTLRPCRTYQLFTRTPQVNNGVPCVRPGRLPGLFGRDKNNLLAKHHGIYVEKHLHCYRKSQECQRCMQSCVLHMNRTAACRPSAEPGDNGLSPRLEKCYNCCTRDNCTAICQQYFRPNCKPKLCMNGSLLEFELRPTWADTQGGRFFCHMRLRQRKPVYHLEFWLYRNNHKLTKQPFTAVLHPTNDNIKPLMRNHYHFLTANYRTGLSELPVVVGGGRTSQIGYRWSKSGTPLVPGIGSSRVRSIGITSLAGIPVWTKTPMALNSKLWSSKTCEEAEQSLDLLYRDTGLDPLEPISQLQVVYTGKYQYRVTRSGIPPKVNFTIPRTASVLSALFKRTYVHRGDYLRADLIFDRSVGKGGHRWIVRVSGAVAAKPGLFRLQLFQVVEPVGKPLYDYEIGVFQERRFQVEFIVPAPNEEPTYTKAYKILILDTKGKMELHVERPPQDAKKLATVRSFQASTVPRPDVFPSVAVKAAPNVNELGLLGIEDKWWWGVIGAIVILCLMLLVGHLTEPTEMILGRKDTTKQPDYQSDPSCQHRFLFMIFVVLKAAYSFALTLTALLIVARVLTDLPADQSSSYENFFSNISVHERLLLDKMDLHLTRELDRQRTWVENRKRACENRLNITYRQLEQKLSQYSAHSAWNRAQVHISEAVLERARAQIRNLSLELQRGRELFEQAAMDSVIQLISDIRTTQDRLYKNKWLQGAHKIHDMVRAQRSSRAGSAVDDFARWAKISMDPATTVPNLVISSALPLPNTSQLVLGPLLLPSYKPYNEPVLELDRNIWYVRDESITHGMSGDLGGDMSQRGGSGKSGYGERSNIDSPPKPPVQLTWHHLLGIALTLDAMLLLYRFLHALDGAQQILSGSPVIIDCTRSSLTRNRKGEIVQPDWKIKMKRTVIRTMESDFIPLSVAAAFAYLFVFLLATYSHDLVSEQTLDAIGFYDNLVLPVHARNRLVNTHIATQAERINQVELSHFERSANARFEQYQFILAEWKDWLNRLERAQCEELLKYKERDSGIPPHCLEFEKIRRAAKELVFEGCSLEKVQPRLYEGYNEKLFFDSIVENSRPFILSIRRWLANIILALFAFVSTTVVWNLLSANTWFYLRRWNMIRQKELYELDIKGSL